MLAQLASVNKDLEEEFELLRSEVLQGRPGGIGYLSLELRQSRGLKFGRVTTERCLRRGLSK